MKLCINTDNSLHDIIDKSLDESGEKDKHGSLKIKQNIGNKPK